MPCYEVVMDWMSPGALREAKAASYQAGKKDRKCGTCRHFRVRPNEVEVAQVARPMAYCGPGRHCFGGPVRGTCAVHGAMKESTQLCGHYQRGAPGVRGVGSGNQSQPSRGSPNVDPEGSRGWADHIKEPAAADGNLLAFGLVGALALGSALLSGVKWTRRDIEGLPYVVDREGLRYPYDLVPGGERVVVYLPAGRKVEHHVTARAVRDPRQLAAEVENVVTDSYESLG